MSGPSPPAPTSITLERGPLRFTALTAGEGPLVLCLHGFPDHARSFRHQMPALVDAGFRVVAPMMRGYEPSSQPRDGDYHLLRLAEDVLCFLDQLGAERAHIVGHDWGAVVTYVACALAPERFASATTMAVAHLGGIQRRMLRKRPSQLLKSWYMLFFQLRGLADLVVEARDFALIEWLWRRWSPGFSLPDDELEALKATLRAPGVKKAALGYYRALHPFRADFFRLSRQMAPPLEVPTLALTGALDGCMDTRLHDDVMGPADFARGLSVVRVADAGHFLHQEKPEEVNAHLLGWLQAHLDDRTPAAAARSTEPSRARSGPPRTGSPTS